MINIDLLDPVITENLRNRGHSDEQIKNMNWDEAFDEYCEWHGLIGWGFNLRCVMANAKNAQT